MPSAVPRHPPPRLQETPSPGPDDEDDLVNTDEVETDIEDELLQDELDQVTETIGAEEEEYEMSAVEELIAEPQPPPLPPNLKEISSLAHWSVSTAKPGCSVAQLRNPNTALFWQSDGPQPHLLNIHFFKMVAISAMRIYLDFSQDESYTPTKIAFLAGTGYNNLIEFSVMTFESPRGWIEVDMEDVGRVVESDEEADDSSSESDLNSDDDCFGGNSAQNREARRRARREARRLPILKAFLVQVRILENHQHGKDTHLRGLQIYAKDTKAKGPPEHKSRRMTLRSSTVKKRLGSREKKSSQAQIPDWDAMPELR